ncbi:MAG: hypothetical protein RR482_00450 [Clostridia bacterium]
MNAVEQEEKCLLSSITDGFGFDLGDGESAIAWLKTDTRTEPQMLEIRGHRSVLTAVADHPSRGVLIGEEAYQMVGVHALYVRFKSHYLSDTEDAAQKLQWFAHGVIESLQREGRLSDPAHACFYVGCPSGWTEATREQYRKLLLGAGVPNVHMISESRAAFMYARESGELRVSQELLNQPTLIIDAGSSTTDFTYVVNLQEQLLSINDFGHTQLGGGLIDRMLWEYNLRRSPIRAQLQALLIKCPQYAARCELEARKVKEMYFTQAAQDVAAAYRIPSESSFKIYYEQPPWTVDVRCTQEDMERILTQALPELGGKGILQTFEQALQSAKEGMTQALPRLILLTGGASRMGFITNLCSHVFPDAVLLRGMEPEFAIARGLAYTLRMEQRIQGFFTEVDAMIESDQVEELVLSALPELFDDIAMPLANALTGKITLASFSRWQQGQITTLTETADEMTRQAMSYFQSTEMMELLEPVILHWLTDLQPEIETLTDPICDRYGIARTSLRLPALLSLSTVEIRFDTRDLMQWGGLKVLLDMMIASLMAALLGGGGVALLATGPVGTVIGFALGLLAAGIGTEAADRMLRGANIPLALRKLFPLKRFERTLQGKRGQLSASIAKQLQTRLQSPTQDVTQMVEGIAQAIEQQLRKAAEQAILLIH